MFDDARGAVAESLSAADRTSDMLHLPFDPTGRLRPAADPRNIVEIFSFGYHPPEHSERLKRSVLRERDPERSEAQSKRTS
jgi:hypothetical protein